MRLFRFREKLWYVEVAEVPGEEVARQVAPGDYNTRGGHV